MSNTKATIETAIENLKEVYDELEHIEDMVHDPINGFSLPDIDSDLQDLITDAQHHVSKSRQCLFKAILNLEVKEN